MRFGLIGPYRSFGGPNDLLIVGRIEQRKGWFEKPPCALMQVYGTLWRHQRRCTPGRMDCSTRLGSGAPRVECLLGGLRTP